MDELLALGLLLLLAKLAEEAFERAKLVRFLGPVVVGIALGPGALGLVQVGPVVGFVSELGIVFLLFLAGAEELESGASVSPKLIASTALGLAIPLAAVSPLLFAVGQFNLLIVIPLAMTSVGPMVRLLSDLGLTGTKEGITAFSLGLINETAAIVAFSALLNFRPIFIALIAVLLTAVVLGGKAFASLLKRSEMVIGAREAETAFIISLILILGYFTSLLNFNLAITAFFLGAVLRDYLSQRPQTASRLRAITYGFFEPVFFASIGLYFVKISQDLFLLSLALALVILVSKVLSGYLEGLMLKTSPRTIALGASTKGGVDISLLITALGATVISGAQYTVSTIAITVSALVVPLAFRAVHKNEVKPQIRVRSVKDVAIDLKVSADQTVREAVDLVEKNGIRALVVVDEGSRPIGIITVTTMIETPVELYNVLKVTEVQLEDVVVINEKASLSEALNLFALTGTAVIAVVDDRGRFSGALYERRMLEALLRS